MESFHKRMFLTKYYILTLRRLIKEAGLNGITTYIPWNLHEPYPGSFDFTQSYKIILKEFSKNCGEFCIIF